MPFKQTIAAKIFGLAIFLSLLTVGLAVFLLREVSRTADGLNTLARLDVPLAESIARINEFGLRRRLAFERTFGALNAPQPNQEILDEAAKNYTTYTDRVNAEILTTRDLLNAYPKDSPARDTLVEIRTLLDQIQPAYPMIGARHREVVELQLAGRHDEANRQINLLNDTQRTVQSQRELIR